VAFRKAVAGNPRAADLVRQLGETLMLAREYQEADQVFARTIDLAPDVEEGYLERAQNLILWRGDVVAAQKIIDDGLSISTLRQNESVSPVDFTVAVMRDDFVAAERAVRRIRGSGMENQFTVSPSALLLAHIEEFRGAHAKAKAYYDSARVILERRLRSTPDDERIHSALGITYAALGRAAEALKEGDRGVALMPVDKDAWRGSFRLGDLAQIYAMVGEKDKAIDLLQRLLSIPSEFSPNYIRLDPKWKSLRGNKRFEAMVKQ
jgi:tetratricopeptide (TPR) repeat protein